MRRWFSTRMKQKIGVTLVVVLFLQTPLSIAHSLKKVVSIPNAAWNLVAQKVRGGEIKLADKNDPYIDLDRLFREIIEEQGSSTPDSVVKCYKSINRGSTTLNKDLFVKALPEILKKLLQEEEKNRSPERAPHAPSGSINQAGNAISTVTDEVSQVKAIVGTNKTRLGLVTENPSRNSVLSILGNITSILGPNTTVSSGIRSIFTDFRETWTILGYDDGDGRTVKDDLTGTLTTLGSEYSGSGRTVFADFSNTWTVLGYDDADARTVKEDLTYTLTTLGNYSTSGRTVEGELVATKTMLGYGDAAQGPGRTVAADLLATLTTLGTLYATSGDRTVWVDFARTWTMVQAVQVEVDQIGDYDGTENRETILEDFNATWTVLGYDDADVHTVKDDLIATQTSVGNFSNDRTVEGELVATLTSLGYTDLTNDRRVSNDLYATLTTLSLEYYNSGRTVKQDFNETWTALGNFSNDRTVEGELVATKTMLGYGDAAQGPDRTVAADLLATLTTLGTLYATSGDRTVWVDFARTWTMVQAVQVEVDQIGDYDGTANRETVLEDFNGTWTVLNELTYTWTTVGLVDQEGVVDSPAYADAAAVNNSQNTVIQWLKTIYMAIQNIAA